ncbi:MAG: nucleotidyltransferase family protein [Desulfobacula sp.]|nr:nucleotidyltransferase family protein [Desulfobacula sp.]
MTAIHVKQLKQLVTSDVNWQLVIDTAIEHRLANFLYQNLKTIGDELIPQTILAKLKNHYVQNSIRNLALSASLIKLLSLLEEINIATVPFKGPVQAQLIYGDPGLRSFSDLDILVKEKDAVKARDHLISLGFNTDVKIPDQQIKTYLEKENFFHLANNSRTINIDLHWEITGRYSLKPIHYKDLEDRFEQIEMSGKNITALSIEDTLIHLCIHGTSHCWDKLEMICSVAEIIKSKRIKDWDIVIAKARILKCKRMVYLALVLAERLFETILPEDLKDEIDNDGVTQKLAKKIIEKIMNQSPGFTETLSWRFSPIHFSVRDSILDRIRYAIRLFFQPTIREWDKYPLPDLLLFLYYFLRPYRLISEGFKKRHA